MNHTQNEVMQFVRENDVKFIRLGFCDPFGIQKNISIMPEELADAFTYGVSFDASAIAGFQDADQSDLLLFPDPATLTVLPWRPGPGRVIRFYCDIKTPDGAVFAGDTRSMLKRVAAQYEALGYVCKVGAECEFYLFQTDEDGEPTQKPLDRGGYLDISPLDKGENIRREICLCLEEMGIQPEASHHEQGPGQNEIDFKFSDALSSADHLLTFKSVVKAIAARNGLFASFLPKPLANMAGSGLHVNLSLAQNGLNIFRNAAQGHSPVAESFIAGILRRAADMTLFLNPLTNSYERFGSFEAPKYISWSHQNRSQLSRIPAAVGERVRMELRSPDPAINPYLAFALILSAGLEGMEDGLALPPAVDGNLFDAEAGEKASLTPLPGTLAEAVSAVEASPFVKGVVGEPLLSKYQLQKRREAEDCRRAESMDAFTRKRYFHLI